MPDLLTKGSNWLAAQRRQHLSRMVQYQRGQESVDLPATVGQTVTETTDDYGAVIRHMSRDYLIAVGDLVLGGVSAKPARGDLIIDEGQHHEVLAVPGGPCFQIDRDHTTFRIHTKHVAETDP